MRPFTPSRPEPEAETASHAKPQPGRNCRRSGSFRPRSGYARQRSNLYNILNLNNNFLIFGAGTTIALFWFEIFYPKKQSARPFMISSSVPSPIAYEPPAPRRETARAKDNLGFAQILEAASADQSEPSQDAKGADASPETVRVQKRAEKAPRSRDDNKADAAKPTASTGETNPKSESDTQTPSDIDQNITAQHDESGANNPTIQIAHGSDTDAETPRVENQTIFIDEQNSEKSEDKTPLVTMAFLMPQRDSSTAQEIPQTQNAKAKDLLLIDETKIKPKGPAETTLALVTLKREDEGSATDIDDLDGLTDADLNTDPLILDDKGLQPKSAKTDMIIQPNLTLLTLISNSSQQNKYNVNNTDVSGNTDADNANRSINTSLLQNVSPNNPSVMTSTRDETAQTFVNNDQETPFDALTLKSADMALDQNISTQASPFVSTHSSTPVLSVHTPPIMTSGRIVYPSLPYSRVPMEIGLSTLEGQRSIQVRLSPADLGTIDIELDVSDQSEARAHISADDPRTLAMLKQDAPLIRQALEQTGLSTNGDSLNFSLRQDNQSGARQNPNEQRASSITSTQKESSSDQAAPLSAPPPPTPMKRITSLLDLNI